jgi:phosphoribosylaminoimidazolecarboxamide formyltransferase/IMP cyclohydrolase
MVKYYVTRKPTSKGFFFGDFEAIFNKVHGKELSYNNLLDVDAAVHLINEFKTTVLLFYIKAQCMRVA